MRNLIILLIFIKLTGLDDKPVFVNPDTVFSVKQPSLVDPTTITTELGATIKVRESAEEVLERFGKIKNE